MKIRRARRRKIGLTSAARVLPIGQKATGATNSFDEGLLKAAERSNALGDPFENDYQMDAVGSHQPINPDADLNGMANVVTVSNILRQCIEAMVTNTTSFGYTLEYIGPEGQENGKEQQAEKRRAMALLDNPTPGESLRETFERMAWDKESIGFRALEAIRDEDTNEIVSFNHLPAITMRKTKQDRIPTKYLEETLDPETGVIERKAVTRRFRRYIQRIGSSKIYFKEIGDPRNIDMRTGGVIPEKDLEANREFLATEVLWDEFYTPGKSYGQPRWIGVLPEILGSRESVLVNLNFFRENAIPAMAVLVSGGALTQDTFENLSQYITAVRGADAMQRILILEASADELGSTEHSAPAPRIELKPMISERQQDGLFRDYDIHNITKVRSSFRLPPILVGKAEDYTRASALASIKTAEDQVFLPERTRNDEMMNNHILSSLGLRFWKYRSNGPVTTDVEDLAKILESLGAAGALTPNVVIKLANKMLGVYIEPVLDDWGDFPFEIIQSYVDQGATIKGMEKFIKELKKEVAPTPPAAANQNAPAKPKVLPLAKAQRLRRRARAKASVLRIAENIEKMIEGRAA